MTQSKIIFLVLITLLLLTALPSPAAMTSVPKVFSAPVVLHDEGGNVLGDGEYDVLIVLKDSGGLVLYEEEQVVGVVNGVAALTVGQGYVAGSDGGQATSGLTSEIFETDDEITVEISVAGQSVTQEMAILGSQPYAFVSDFALRVMPDAVTSSSILDGTIVAADLDKAFLQELQSANVVDSEGGVVNAENIGMSADTALSNSGATSVEGVLIDLDAAIESVRDIDLAQSLENVLEEVSVNYLRKDGATALTGDLTLGGHAITDVGDIDGVDVSELKLGVDALDGTYATDDDLSGHAALATGVHGIGSANTVVGTGASQTLQNKTIDATNSISADAVSGGTLAPDFIDGAMATDVETSIAVSAHASTDSGVHGIGSGSAVVGTNFTQTLKNKTIDATNSISADAITGGTLDVDYIDGAITTDSELAEVVGRVALLEEDTTLEGRVTTLEADTITEEELPSAIRPFAYGVMSRASGGTCSGYNIDADCTFTDNPGGSDYAVVMTPVQSGSACGSYAAQCFVSSKGTSGFAVSCTCPSGGGAAFNPEIDFVVFY